MKKYDVEYKIAGTGHIEVMANSEEEAIEEIDRIFCGDNRIYSENSWIDGDVLFDVEWDTAEPTDAKEK